VWVVSSPSLSRVASSPTVPSPHPTVWALRICLKTALECPVPFLSLRTKSFCHILAILDIFRSSLGVYGIPSHPHPTGFPLRSLIPRDTPYGMIHDFLFNLVLCLSSSSVSEIRSLSDSASRLMGLRGNRTDHLSYTGRIVASGRILLNEKSRNTVGNNFPRCPSIPAEFRAVESEFLGPPFKLLNASSSVYVVARLPLPSFAKSGGLSNCSA